MVYKVLVYKTTGYSALSILRDRNHKPLKPKLIPDGLRRNR